MATLEELLQEVTSAGTIPGLSLATLRAGAFSANFSLGIRGSHDPSPVDAHTVFEAASLTKPLVAFIALQLAEEGLLDLDMPLIDICGEYVRGDERARSPGSSAHCKRPITAPLETLARERLFQPPGLRSGQPERFRARRNHLLAFSLVRRSLGWGRCRRSLGSTASLLLGRGWRCR